MKLGLITGITGQDGSYLAELLLEKKYKVYGTVRRNSYIHNYKRIDHIRDKLELYYYDLMDNSINRIINEIINSNKDFEVLEIYNLAAQSHVQISFDIPEYTCNTNSLGVLNILETIRNLDNNIKTKIKFYQAGTSEMYGKVLETPQNENTPFNPQSPYACSKVFSHFLVNNYKDSYDIFACNGILFNHESSRRGYNFVTMKIIRGIKSIINGDLKFIELGNIYSKRDWGHAKDYVYGMWLMLQQDISDNYVLASGKTYSIKYFIEKCFEYMGKTITWNGSGLNEVGIDETNIIRIKINKKYFRPSEVDVLLGDPTKSIKNLNWIKEYDSIDKIIEEMFTI
jgi:GDPmannose 4,6-dehydratase